MYTLDLFLISILPYHVHFVPPLCPILVYHFILLIIIFTFPRKASKQYIFGDAIPLSSLIFYLIFLSSLSKKIFFRAFTTYLRIIKRAVEVFFADFAGAYIFFVFFGFSQIVIIRDAMPAKTFLEDLLLAFD